MKHRLFPAFLALALAGCGQLLGETTTIQLKTTAPVLKEDEAVITARLRDHTSTLSPVYSFATTDAGVVITAKGSPPEDSLQFLLRHRGVLEVKSAYGGTWFTNKDVADAQAGIDDRQRPALNLVLTSEAAARVARLSSRSAGAIVVAELDGEQLTSAQISEPIPGGRLQISLGKTPKDAMLIATILRTGALSFATSSVQVKDLAVKN